MFDQMDGSMWALAKKKKQWKEDLYFTVTFPWQTLSKSYADVTPMKGMHIISAPIVDPWWKLQSFRKRDKGVDINPEDETSYTTKLNEAFQKFVENEYYAKRRKLPIIKAERVLHNTLLPSKTASGSGQSYGDPYDLSSEEEEYPTPEHVAKMTPRRSDWPACSLEAAKLYMKSPPESPKTWEHVNPNLSGYHSDLMKISRTFRIPHITYWWHQQEHTRSKYTNFSDVARDIFSIIPHGVGVEEGFSLAQDNIGWRQWKTTGGTLREQVVLWQLPLANNRIFEGNHPELNLTETQNALEVQLEVEESTLHTTPKVHNFFETWQGSHNPCTTQKESCTQNRQMTAIKSISGTEEIVKAS